MSQIAINSNLIAMLLATQLVFALYGAGIRRPFGSLATIADLPPAVRRASAITIFADLLFAAFLLWMWWFFIARMDLLQFLVLAIVFGVIGHYLSHRIRLVPSFFISLALGAFCIFAVSQLDAGPTIALSFSPSGK
ncbi:hypothetical protein [Bradyrhizobium sp.]|uniref:hypothetical protein n=1 Tax=Bradyrhizobium sp. TaxID=376 RepID=UPI004037FBFE